MMQVRALVSMRVLLTMSLAACGKGEVQVVKPVQAAASGQQLVGTWQSTGDEDVVRAAPGSQVQSGFQLASCKEREQSLSETERQQCSEVMKALNLK